YREVPESSGVPRAVFLGLLHTAPGGLTFVSTAMAPSTAPRRQALPAVRRLATPSALPPRRTRDAREGAPGSHALGRSGPGALRPLPEATATRPASKDALETPLGVETGYVEYIPILKNVKA